MAATADRAVTTDRMPDELGMRERKKLQARRLIFDTANRLFVEKGFDRVTVAEVARAADVSEPTVFNHFPTKEDLFFGGMTFFEDELLATVRERVGGETISGAFARKVLDGSSRLGDGGTADLIAKAAKLIGESQALQTREREIAESYTERLAELIAANTGTKLAEVECRAVAAALMGVHRALVAFVRSKVLEGQRGRSLTTGARTQAARAFRRLDIGLADFPSGAADSNSKVFRGAKPGRRG